MIAVGKVIPQASQRVHSSSYTYPWLWALDHPHCAQSMYFIYVLSLVFMALKTKQTEQALRYTWTQLTSNKCKLWTFKKKITPMARYGIIVFFIHCFMRFLIILLISLKTVTILYLEVCLGSMGSPHLLIRCLQKMALKIYFSLKNQ